MISIANVSERDGKQMEEVVKRKVEWGEALELGVVPQGAACVILMQDGGVGRIGTQALMSTWESGQTCWIEMAHSDYSTEIEVAVTCKVLNPATSSLEENASKEKDSKLSKAVKGLELLDEGSSISFLLMCLFVHLLYGVDGFHWSHKCCLTIGAALAITTILNGSSRVSSNASQNTTRTAAASNFLPKLQFTVTVHRCRIKMEGTEYLFPENAMKK